MDTLFEPMATPFATLTLALLPTTIAFVAAAPTEELLPTIRAPFAPSGMVLLLPNMPALSASMVLLLPTE
ncbi:MULTISPECIES: hypothetical protein [unclassified Novosphingobium]|uniref:hypothetical protein n=1 Tax=unclassified Novosphingobium TaxID=2644732 RepID=UPI00146D4C3B|nr:MULTISPECIES: hypothetical protein [unclassified Novosphingobium]NMN03859.1 hypothetical protein [Novosphingobium sp. SG919]NMN86151.1 hypothetical protein [Novosphingobium sp. SG916]